MEGGTSFSQYTAGSVFCIDNNVQTDEQESRLQHSSVAGDRTSLCSSKCGNGRHMATVREKEGGCG
jgi:hypothetical protein